MIIDYIKKVWQFINNMNSQVKTLIILLFIGYLLYPLVIRENNKLITDYFHKVEDQNTEDEQYTLKMAHFINEDIQAMQLADPNCYNVLLLNFHNSKRSLQGFRYLYLNCITESTKDPQGVNLKEYWSNLEYVYYEQEIEKIRAKKYLYVENIQDIKETYPRLYRKLLVSDAKAAAFYPIEGIESPVGMVVILYQKPIKLAPGYYAQQIAPWIQKLSSILDYQNIKKLQNEK